MQTVEELRQEIVIDSVLEHFTGRDIAGKVDKQVLDGTVRFGTPQGDTIRYSHDLTEEAMNHVAIRLENPDGTVTDRYFTRMHAQDSNDDFFSDENDTPFRAVAWIETDFNGHMLNNGADTTLRLSFPGADTSEGFVLPFTGIEYRNAIDVLNGKAAPASLEDVREFIDNAMQETEAYAARDAAATGNPNAFSYGKVAIGTHSLGSVNGLAAKAFYDYGEGIVNTDGERIEAQVLGIESWGLGNRQAYLGAELSNPDSTLRQELIGDRVLSAEETHALFNDKVFTVLSVEEKDGSYAHSTFLSGLASADSPINATTGTVIYVNTGDSSHKLVPIADALAKENGASILLNSEFGQLTDAQVRHATGGETAEELGSFLRDAGITLHDASPTQSLGMPLANEAMQAPVTPDLRK